MEKGCVNFVFDNDLDIARNSYYFTKTLNLDKMKKNCFEYEKIDVCNCCKKEKNCQKTASVKQSFIQEYFDKFIA